MPPCTKRLPFLRLALYSRRTNSRLRKPQVYWSALSKSVCLGLPTAWRVRLSPQACRRTSLRTRFTNDQFGFEQNLSLRDTGFLDSLNQQSRGDRPHFTHRLPNRRQRRLAIFSYWNIIVANYRDVVWYAPASLAQRS